METHYRLFSQQCVGANKRTDAEDRAHNPEGLPEAAFSKIDGDVEEHFTLSAYGLGRGKFSSYNVNTLVLLAEIRCSTQVKELQDSRREKKVGPGDSGDPEDATGAVTI